MKVTRIPHIRGHRIYREFVWPSSMLPFSRFNVIYGWNASGKTTLSALLHHLERRQPITEGDVEFEIDGAKVGGASLQTATLPTVRVFNRDFIASTVVAPTTPILPIFYVGENSAEKEKKVTELKIAKKKAEDQLEDLQKAKTAADKSLDTFLISTAKLIKECLIGCHATSFNNYDKRRARQGLEKLTPATAASFLLDEETKTSFQKQKDSQPKGDIASFSITIPDFRSLEEQTRSALARSVVSEVIESLAADARVGNWVQAGLHLHTADYATNTCRFCEQPLTQERAKALRGHFNDAFAAFQQELDGLEKHIGSAQRSMVDLKLPEPSRCYEHLQAELEGGNRDLAALASKAAAFAAALQNAVRIKKQSPLESTDFDPPLFPAPDVEAIENAVGVISGAIDQHNAITRQFQAEVEKACLALENHFLAEAFSEFIELRTTAKAAAEAVAAAQDKPGQIQNEIDVVERDIVEHRRPAEELNAELRAYLGHDELHLAIRDSGYIMKRSGQPATNLSEGERTAIAFLYFLKSLQDKSADLSEMVVVIDDPVSSLDANALYSAFGYMKNRTAPVGQLFILTHNFSFFRQVRNWFHHLPNQRKADPNVRPARFYSLQAMVESGQRCSTLTPIDPLLEQYESEYHFLFKRVFDEATHAGPVRALEHHYGMPNIARRLLESFLAFRYPDQSGDLWKRLGVVQWDVAKQTRIMRFTHTHSHSNTVSEPEHDPSVLSETKAILTDLLDMIKYVDRDHYEGMVRIVNPGTDEE